MPNIYEFLNRMDSYKSGLAAAPTYEKHSARFLQAVDTFEGYMLKFTVLKKGK